MVQVAAFACMSTYLIPAVLLWQVAGSTAKAGAMIHIFGGMLSIMLVRTAYRPMTIANSLPLAGVVPIIAILETETEGSGDQIFLGAAVLILAGYFILTLQAALRSNRALAGARDAALARVETQRRFLATMSHELRTPLNGILGIAQGLVASHPGQGAESICDSAREMSAMVDDLLDNAAIAAYRPQAGSPFTDDAAAGRALACSLHRKEPQAASDHIARLARVDDVGSPALVTMPVEPVGQRAATDRFGRRQR